MKAILTFLIAFSATELHSQTLVYDYQSGEYVKDLLCAKAGSNVVYQIININRFAKKAKIEGELSVLSTDIPSELASIFRLKSEAEENLTKTKIEVTEMEILKKEVNDNVAGAKNSIAAQDEVKQMDSLLAYCKEYLAQAEKANAVLALKEALMRIVNDESNYNLGLMKAALDSAQIDTTAIKTQRINYDKFVEAYIRVYLQYEKAESAAMKADERSHASKIENAKEQVEKSYNALNKQYRSARQSIDSLFYAATKPNNYTISYHKSVDKDVDLLTFLVRVGDIKEDFDKMEPLTKQIPISGGVKIDYSVGITFRYISDHEFYFDSNDQKLQRLTRDKLNAMTPAITSMIHIYKRAPSRRCPPG